MMITMITKMNRIVIAPSYFSSLFFIRVSPGIRASRYAAGAAECSVAGAAGYLLVPAHLA